MASSTLTVAAIALALCRPQFGLSAPSDCPKCAEWSKSQSPFRIYGNTYYVGTRALSAILIASAAGHVLIDGTVDETAAQVAANVRALGFRVEDIRLILNSHVHFDHAGGISQLQHWSGAQVAASGPSARVLLTGRSGADDPLYGEVREMTAIPSVQVIEDRQIPRVGELRMTAHLTPGHTPGGTSWSWSSCEGNRCLHLVYADSLSPVSNKSFRFSRSPTYPNVLTDFARSFSVIRGLPCDIQLTPHPEFSDVLGRLQRRESVDDSAAFVDPSACRHYVATAEATLNHRLAEETASALATPK
ncbi:MAG: subclass B3 metallo-beta-lactamase [Gammaproteobacteria bacterium]|nr:subclass B3 metallo-beta-lactamase [Gammaproteobacteria bacterium]